MDLVVHISIDEMNISETDQEVILEGQTIYGIHIMGVDIISIVPKD